MKKQIHLYKSEKVKFLDHMQQPHDNEYYDDQIEETEKVLSLMAKDLDKIMDDSNWPYEIRAFISSHKIKHCFQYEGNPFLVSYFNL